MKIQDFGCHPHIQSQPGQTTIRNSQKATEMSIFIVRAFVQLREVISTHKELIDKLQELENKVSGYDQAIANLFEAIRQLMAPPAQQRRFVGFRTNLGDE